MYYTARGKDLTQQNRLDIHTAQKFLDMLTLNKSIQPFFDMYEVKRVAIAPFNHFAKCLIRIIDVDKVEVLGIYDQMYYKFPNGFRDIEICGYENISDTNADLYIITSNYYQNEIIDTLVMHGIPLEKIVGINTLLFGTERL